MVAQSMKLKQSLPDSNKGFTLVELLVTTLIASVVLGLSLSLITDQRKQYVTNQVRSEVNQTLRTAIDLIGTDIQLAGSRLKNDSNLPVVSVINGASGAPDQLILQQKLIGNTLPLCATLSGSTTTITVAKKLPLPPTLPIPTCEAEWSDSPINNLTDALDAFKNYRCGIDGTPACDARTAAPTPGNCIEECPWAYIYDPVYKRGEFFQYGFEAANLTGTENYIYKGSPGNWQYTYTYNSSNSANNPIIYLLEERRYSLNGDELELTINRQGATPLVNKVQNFQVQVSRRTSPTGTPLVFGITDSFNPNYTGAPTPSFTGATAPYWQDIQYLQVDLTAANPADSDAITLKQCANNQCQLSSRFFPRNREPIKP